MDEKTEDRRVRRTKAALRKALTTLMEQKKPQDITVRELAQMCDINRGTFYIHYRDVYDMMAKIENEMLDEFKKVLYSFTARDMREKPRPILTQFFRFLSDNADMGGALLGPNGDISFVREIRALVQEKCVHAWSSLYDPADSSLFEYYSNYIVSGCVGLFEEWLAHGRQETPERMAELAEHMILGSVATLTKGI